MLRSTPSIPDKNLFTSNDANAYILSGVVAGHGVSTFAMHLTMVFDGLTPTKPGHKAPIYTTFSSTNSLIHGVRLPRFEATDT